MNLDANLLVLWCEQRGLEIRRELKFHPSRKWRFDFALPQYSIAIELEGLVKPNDSRRRMSRHTTNAGYAKDCEKYNSAIVLGWRVLRYTQSQFRSGQPLVDIEMLINVSPK